MTNAEYVQEMARAAGIDPSSIELVDCSGIGRDDPLEEWPQLMQAFSNWLDDAGACEQALRDAAAEREHRKGGGS